MVTYRCRITLTSHGAVFSHMTPLAKAALWDVVSKNRSYRFEYNPRTRKNVRVVGDDFFFIPEDRRHVAIHRNQLDEALKALSLVDVHPANIEYVYNDTYPGVDVNIEIVGGKSPRGYQVPIIENAVELFANPKGNAPTSCLPVQTGRGKTLMALFIAERIGKRIGVLCASTYTQKWVMDLDENLVGIDKKTAVSISGCTQLITAYNKEKDFASKGESTGVIAYIISLETLNSFIKRFILKRERFDGDPHELFQVLGIGFVIKDEVHQLFHMLFKTEVYTHSRAVMALSATIEDKRDQFKERMYHVMWPKAMRYEKLEKIKYTDVYDYTYRVPNIQPFTYMRNGSYSHNKFEESLLSNANAKDDYLDMIGSLVDEEFIGKMKSGERCLVYASMNEMVENISDYLTGRYPHLNIGEYIRQDPIENILTSDITVTSPTKAAAALDVPELSTVLNTVNTGSQKRIVQTAGRLREPKDSTRRYVYPHCSDIPKHYEYHNFTRECLNDVVKTMTTGAKQYTVTFKKKEK